MAGIAMSFANLYPGDAIETARAARSRIALMQKNYEATAARGAFPPTPRPSAWADQRHGRLENVADAD